MPQSKKSFQLLNIDTRRSLENKTERDNLAQDFIKYNQRTREFGLPWKSGLNKVYHTVPTALCFEIIKPMCHKKTQVTQQLGSFA